MLAKMKSVVLERKEICCIVICDVSLSDNERDSWLGRQEK